MDDLYCSGMDDHDEHEWTAPDLNGVVYYCTGIPPVWWFDMFTKID